MLRVRHLCVFALLHGEQAALLKPYIGTNSSGETNWAPSLLNEFVAVLEQDGWQAS